MGIKYGMVYAQELILLVVSTSMLAVSFANHIPICHCNHTSSTIVVGGSVGWTFGFNYTDWALRNGPFYLNDTLVFKYDAPNATTFPHSVSLFPNYWNFKNCDLRKSKLVGNTTVGVGEGFHFVLKKREPHYFVCGERAGLHCTKGLMKFIVMPLPLCHG